MSRSGQCRSERLHDDNGDRAEQQHDDGRVLTVLPGGWVAGTAWPSRPHRIATPSTPSRRRAALSTPRTAVHSGRESYHNGEEADREREDAIGMRGQVL
ncbi:hypothetical protein GCM10010921_30170 [Microbacterium album]|uniref:Uncharacterized protein n=1 Tax=Microbacterium album TaxID=2053191 RepID=A0A917MNG0_9MICO|nr:hypothetical protein GCM10010921_30170 [Microbacterium album]